MKKILATMVSVVILLSVNVTPINAAESGKCGDSVFWEVENGDTLIISGMGEMYDNPFGPFMGNITKVVINDGVTSIGYQAFMYVSNITQIAIPDSVVTIGDNAFLGCNLLESVIIPSSVTSIGESAFSNCDSLKTVVIPDGVTTIKLSTFYSCDSLTEVTIPDSVIAIENFAFSYCKSLKSITIPNSVSSIGVQAFSYCKALKSIVIPDSVTFIDDNAFFYSEALTEIYIPTSVKSMGGFVFATWSEHTDVYYAGTQEQWNVISGSENNVDNPRVTIHYSSLPPQKTPEIKVTFNGERISFDQPPIIENDRTLVPLRAIFETLGATVEWEQTTQTVTSKRDDIIITLQIGSSIMKKNNEEIVLDVPAQITNERTLVPARAVAEAFGCFVDWDGNTRTVIIEE